MGPFCGFLTAGAAASRVVEDWWDFAFVV